MKNAILFSIFASFLMSNASHHIDCITNRELPTQKVEESTDQCKQNQQKGDDRLCFLGSSEELAELIRDLAFLAIVLPVASYLITFPCDSSPML